MEKLVMPYTKGSLQLKNHVVMAPMTRSRAINNLPNALMATYYKQRSGADLIITEGTSPSPEGLGYARIRGIFAEEGRRTPDLGLPKQRSKPPGHWLYAHFRQSFDTLENASGDPQRLFQ